MKRPIAIFLSPNSSAQDARLALRLLFLHMHWNDKRILSRAAEKIATRFSGYFVSLSSSGRQALYDLLRSYAIGKGDEVIIQAFTCIAVPEPILWTGATPIYADVSKDSYSFDIDDVKKKITPKTRAIIVQHTFGIPGPIEEIIALTKDRNIFIIEDCTHTLGVVHNGKMLGTFGDAAILSFGRDKYVSSVFGGAVITKDKNRAHAIRAMQSFRKLPPKIWVAQQLFHVVLLHYVVLPLYFWHQIGKVVLVLAQKLRLISRAVSLEERSGKRPLHHEYSYSPALALLLLCQLDKLDAMIARRREIVERYDKELHTSLSRRGGNVATPLLRYPVEVDNPKGMLLDARSQNMLLGDWYDAPLVPRTANMVKFQYTIGSCPNAEEIARHIINLPTYSLLTDTEVSKVISFMNNYGTAGN